VQRWHAQKKAGIVAGLFLGHAVRHAVLKTEAPGSTYISQHLMQSLHW